MGYYTKKAEIRWSDLDPNFHVRHSAYYDFGAFARVCFMVDHGLTPSVMLQHHMGPVLFREECVFKREIHFNDSVEVNVQLVKNTPDMSRWTMVHEIWKADGVLSAVITVDGAWIDTEKRKLTILPEFLRNVFDSIKSEKGE